MKMKVTIPEGYDDITLGDFQKLRSLQGDDEFITVKTIEILTNIKGNEALRMKAKDRNGIINDLSKALKHEPSKLIRRFKVGDIEFGLIPNFDDMTFGEFLDLETYATEDEQNWHKMLAVLYRPITKEFKDFYDIEKYEGSDKYSGYMKEAPASVALSVLVFFYAIANDLLNNSQKSLTEEVVQQIKKGDLVKNGAGIVQLLDLQQNILKAMRKQLSVTLNNALPDLRTTLINMN